MLRRCLCAHPRVFTAYHVGSSTAHVFLNKSRAFAVTLSERLALHATTCSHSLTQALLCAVKRSVSAVPDRLQWMCLNYVLANASAIAALSKLRRFSTCLGFRGGRRSTDCSRRPASSAPTLLASDDRTVITPGSTERGCGVPQQEGKTAPKHVCILTEETAVGTS